MDFSGEYRIPAPALQVWQALNDADVLKACIPGCRELQRASDSGFVAVVAAKVGPINANFRGRVTPSDLDPSGGHTRSGEGRGGAAGFARVTAHVALVGAGPDTLLRHDAQAEIGSKLASVGSRLVLGRL
jgi:carbon monoxide dehydrogenase subunit G